MLRISILLLNGLILVVPLYSQTLEDALGGPDTNMADSTFGQIISYGGVGGRIGQFGARFTF